MKDAVFLASLAVVAIFFGFVLEPVSVKPRAEMAVFPEARAAGASDGAPETPLAEMNLKLERALTILRRIDGKIP